MTISLDDDQPAERKPGDFKRDRRGTPYVSAPDGGTVKSGARKGEPKWVRYSRPSGYHHAIEDGYNLMRHEQRHGLLGLATDPEVRARLDNLDPELDDWHSVADGIWAAAKEAARYGLAADRGTFVHALTEWHDRGRDQSQRHRLSMDGDALGIDVGTQGALVAVWGGLLERHDLEILAVEAPVVNDYYGTAGTLDRTVRLRRDLHFVVAGELVTIPAGTIVVLDVKTGRMRIDARAGHVTYWHGYSVQCHLYATSVPYDTTTETRGEWPWLVDDRWALIAHLPVQDAIDGDPKATLVLVDLEKGRAAAELCRAAKAWHATNDVFGLPHAPDDEIAPGAASPAPFTVDAPTSAAPAASTAATHADGGAPPPGDPRPRFSALSDAEVALVRARWRWPHKAADLPPDTWAEVGAFLDDVARDAGASFTPTEATLPTPERTVAVRGAQDRPTWTPPDDGGPCDPQAAEAIRAQARSLPGDVRAWISDVTSQAAAAGRPIRGAGDTVRWFEICRSVTNAAIVRTDRWACDDELVRVWLAAVMASEEALQPGVSLGCAFGSLTVDEARRLADALDLAYDGKAAIQFTLGGTPDIHIADGEPAALADLVA